MPVRQVPFAEVREHVLRVTGAVVWSVLTTVDPLGRPRSRIVHPVWFEEGDRLVGLVGVRPTAVKLADIAAHPFVSCSYWTPAFASAFLDCEAAWVPDGERRAAWEAIASTPPPVGYDPAPMWPGGPDGPGFKALRLRPFRVRIQLGSEVATGMPDRFWSEAGEREVRRVGAAAPPEPG